MQINANSVCRSDGIEHLEMDVVGVDVVGVDVVGVNVVGVDVGYPRYCM